MSEGSEAVFDNGRPTLPNNWLDEINRHTRALLVDLPLVPSVPLFGGSYAASKAHEDDRPRRYSGNSHQRRKQRRAQRTK